MSGWPAGTPTAWIRAWRDDALAVEAIIARWIDLDVARWHAAPAPGRWSPALLAEHLVQAYRLGAAVGSPAGTMRTALPPVLASLAGRTVLPLLLWSGRFPRGGRAPAEVVPRAARPDAADGSVALREAAADARAALLAADRQRPRPTITHAYFGVMAPRTALRLLTAHTRHHDRLLAADLAGTGSA